MGGQVVRVFYFPCREVRAAQSIVIIPRREVLGAVSDGVWVSSLSHAFQMAGGHPVLEKEPGLQGRV